MSKGEGDKVLKSAATPVPVDDTDSIPVFSRQCLSPLSNLVIHTQLSVFGVFVQFLFTSFVCNEKLGVINAVISPRDFLLLINKKAFISTFIH